jgi:peptide-methionine (S)-S-oxide reductase
MRPPDWKYAAALALAAAGLLATTHHTLRAQSPMNNTTEQATLGGGCFWCLEAAYETLPGISNVVSGYAAGKTPNPTYKQICSGTTGHAEVVQITFDPKIISYDQILDWFWKIHDPTTPDRQGQDIGTQYRSILLTHNPAQRAAAEASLKKAQEKLQDPIVTQIEPLTTFYPAEDYHQDYFRNNPSQAYCSFVIRPKLKKLGMAP